MNNTIKRALSSSVIISCIACQGEIKETQTQKAERQLYQQSQQTQSERRAEEQTRMQETQKILSELPAYQKMQQEERERKEREAAQRSYGSSTSYDDLESENEELKTEVRRLKSRAGE